MGRPWQSVSVLAALARNRNLRRVELAWGASIAAEWTHFVALGVFAYSAGGDRRSEEHTSELQSRRDLVCRLLLEKKNQSGASRSFSPSLRCRTAGSPSA